jgi:CheY-like chemotaxis protein
MLFDASTTVLIVDDAITVREGLRSMLGMVEITRAESVASAGEARSRLKNRSYDVVLCDYHLGEGMNGQELLEEMRREGLLPFRTIWIMITGERKYERVVAAAEMAPDDYILKPFTSNSLMERLHAAGERKAFLKPAHELLERGKVEQAIEVLAELAGRNDAPYEHRLDAQRLRAELLISIGRQYEALDIYLSLLSQRIIPWARMGVARIYSADGKLEEANELLRGIIDDAPLYTDAYDLLAKNLNTEGEYSDALEVLEMAVGISPRNLSRLHSCGMTALRSGSPEKGAYYLHKAVELSRNTTLFGPELLADLLMAVSASGDVAAVEKVQAEITGLLRGGVEDAFLQHICQVLGMIARDKYDDAYARLCSLEEELSSPWIDLKLALRFLDAVLRLPLTLAEAPAVGWARQITLRFVQGRMDLTEALEVVRCNPACRTAVEDAYNSLHELNNRAAELASAGRVAEAAAMLFEAAMNSHNVRAGMNACALLLKVYEERKRKHQPAVEYEYNIQALLAWLPRSNERVKGFWMRLQAASGEQSDVL